MKGRKITEGMLQEVLYSIDEGIHVVDADGITIFYNAVAAEMDGLTIDEVVGTHLLEAFPSLTHKSSTLLKVLDTGEEIGHHQQSYTNRYGKRIVTVNKTLPVRIKGKLVGAVEVAKDVTQVKELSEKVIELEAQMRGQPQRDRSRRLYRFEQIVTRNPVLLHQIERARRAALTRSPVLVYGETGTGKELVVQSIHQSSPRAHKPFIAQNCAAIPSSLLEGILLGTVRGAFTGAEDRPGLFELADGGTLFLDEIHAMPIDLQAKLLRVLEDGMVRRVGDSRLRPVDVRIVVATNENPVVSVQEGRLRKDLYYRINVVTIMLPPLRERREDLPLLVQHFIQSYNRQFGTQVRGISPRVQEIFEHHTWSGNVRELKHLIEGAMNLVDNGWIQEEHLPEQLGGLEESSSSVIAVDSSRPLRQVLEEVERRMIREALQQCGNNIQQAAKRLGIPRQTLQYKLRRLDLQA